MVRAELECIAYQIADIIIVMKETQNICPIYIPDTQELSGIGVAYMAGIQAWPI